MGLGLSFNKRWFFLISRRPLHENMEDGQILQDSDIPTWMEYDNVYYFTH